MDAESHANTARHNSASHISTQAASRISQSSVLSSNFPLVLVSSLGGERITPEIIHTKVRLVMRHARKSKHIPIACF
jgi:hypothetical protein